MENDRFWSEMGNTVIFQGSGLKKTKLWGISHPRKKNTEYSRYLKDWYAKYNLSKR